MAKQKQQVHQNPKTQTPWAREGKTRTQYKRSVEATILYHVCDNTQILREIFARKGR